jgi:hypothetical protein
MDYITENTYEIPINTISYKIYDPLFYATHLYIVNNLRKHNYEIYNNYEINDIYDDPDPILTDLQYFNIMSFIDEML